ncbi:MAG TPA: FHA domain-containing protein [Actinotalea sp.]|nr:FHA domain-containing protein [Actinotalea sp.]
MSERDAAEQPRWSADTTITFGESPAGEHESGHTLSADEHAAVAALPPTSALLLMRRGPSAGARFLLDSDRTTAGRATDADIFLDDVTVSRKHVEFLREADGFVVRDVGSLNGTYVNRTRIERSLLRPGDEVQIGKFRMTFHPSPARGMVPPATGGGR